ncbi:hypothetical protein GC170_09365 [bacterium]|nr:hypothetical protein [bacterium]
MNESRTKSPGHETVRTFLRTVGPLMLLIGLAFTFVGLASFFSAFGTFEQPRYFWCAFVGMPLVVFGVGMSQFGYMGAIYRYIAAETTPVARDAFNDLGEGIGPGVKAVSKAVSEGVMEAQEESRRRN